MTFKRLVLFLTLLFLTSPAFSGDSRVLHADQVQLQNSGFYTTLQAGTLTGNTTYTLPPVSLAFPSTNGSANYVLRTDGAGVTSWVNTLTTLSASNSTTNGYLSSTDWSTFNGKQATVSSTAPITFSANTIGITQSATAANGYLSSTDWTTFNSKVPTTESISTTAPLLGGGDLSAPRTFSITQAATAANGYLSSTDWNTFNNKENAFTPGNLTEATSSVLTITGGTGSVFGAGTTIQVTKAATAANGYLSSTDWNTFNNKQPAGSYALQSTAINTTAPLSGGGDLSTTRTLSIPAATTSVNGYLTSTDWTTFNGKAPSTRNINTTSPLTGGGDLSADRTLAIPAATTSVNGYLTSTDWATFNGKQAAITIGAISGTSNANGQTLTSGTLALTPADATNGGVVTNSTQTFAGAKTLANNLTLNANAIFPITVDSSTTGSNANLSAATEITRLTNASLTSIATLSTTTAVSGTQALIINATGARITLVNNFGSPPGSSAVILTATGADTTVPDKGSAQFTYSSSSNAWFVTAINRGVQQVADGGTGTTTSTGSGSTVLSTSPTLVTPALGTPTALVLTSATGLPLTTGVTGVLPTGNMAGPAATGTSGYLSSTDWTTFNAKQATISVSAPITLTTATVGITQSGTAGNGYLSSTDWNTFNGKLTSPLTTKGDVLTYSTVPARIGVGGDGTVLTADSTQTTGLKWGSVLTNPMTTLGDIIYENATPAAARLAGNTTSTKNFLTQTGTGSVSAAPAWGTIASGDLPTTITAATTFSTSITTGTAGTPTGYTPSALSVYQEEEDISTSLTQTGWTSAPAKTFKATRIGKVVILTFKIADTNKDGTNSPVGFTGLPARYLDATTEHRFQGVYFEGSSAIVSTLGQITTAGAINFYKSAAAGNWLLTDTAIGTGGNWATITYSVP